LERECESKNVEKECTLKSAYWNPLGGYEKDNARIIVDSGEKVEMVLESENCDGKEVKFTVYESDGVIGKDLVGRSETVINDGMTRVSFKVQWERDYVVGLPIGDNPELLFNPNGYGLNEGSDAKRGKTKIGFKQTFEF